ncbi:transcriptional regulator [Alcaligenes faecalis]|nr:TetR/AcrR family transcriptional regulator [Alcaligenes faecalis]ARP55339.1 transcriptional regulator [Alcaligenes faecalis]
MREAILEAAFRLFAHNGYSNTRMSQIASEAGMTQGNLYRYFDSKFLLLYEIYTPWLHKKLNELRDSVYRFRTPHAQLKRLFIGLWQDIPMSDHSFSNCLLEALTSAPADSGKMTDSLAQVEEFVRGMIKECIPQDRLAHVDPTLLTHLIWMAFDGFAINFRLGDRPDVPGLAAMLTNLLLGTKDQS